MKVAVIGAGVTGLTAARRLGLEGHTCDVYERWPGLGGQAATVELDGGVRIERYYHHWFTSDRHIVELCDELGLDGFVEWLPSSVAFFADGELHPFTTPLDLLRFKPIKLRTRVRMGLAVLRLQRFHREVEPFEHVTTRSWIERNMGEEAWTKVWGPLLRGKFGSRADDVAMTWLHGKLMQRRQVSGSEARQEVLGYPAASFEPLFTALQQAIEASGGRVLVDRPAAEVAAGPDGGFLVTPAAPGAWRSGHDPGSFARLDAAGYDAVLITTSNDIFESMLAPELRERLAPSYLERCHSIDYHAALCLLLELDRPFGSAYWTNIADAGMPFVGLVEHTNLVPVERYGRHLLYVANYVEPGDPLLDLDPDELLDAYEPHLRRINPAFDRSWVSMRWRFAEPAAQPIVDAGYKDRIPPLRTGVDGLFLANTTQVYPEDRGTNYAVVLGEHAAREMLA